MNNQPRPCNAFAHLLGKLVIRTTGWRIAGELPQTRNMVIIAAPHTSNWDLILLLAATYSFGISVNWLGKDSLFRTPLGPLLKYLGGIPVDRSRANNLVDTLAERIRAGNGINLVIPPAGTRGYTDYWKSGFYRIALGAGIPLVCGYLDYAKKEAGFGPSFMPFNLTEDMDRIRAFYEGITARYPERKSRIRLKEEDAEVATG